MSETEWARRESLQQGVAAAYEAWWRARGTDDGTQLRALRGSVEFALADLGETK